MDETVSGGFAFVFMAQDPNTGKDYALKVSYETYMKIIGALWLTV
jgi:hypothetical protein